MKSQAPEAAKREYDDDDAVIDIDSDLLFLNNDVPPRDEEKPTLTPGSTDRDVIKEEVSRSLEAHAPEIQDDVELTPAQIFYMENRERLLAQAQDHLFQKRSFTDEYKNLGVTDDT